MAGKLHRIDWAQEARETDFDVVAAAAGHNVTLRRVEQHFQTCFHEPPQRVFTRLKMEEARRRIEQGVPIQKVADDLGFRHVTHFIRDFREHFGCTPGRHFREVQAAKISHSGHFPSHFGHFVSQIGHKESLTSKAQSIRLKSCKK